MLGKLAAIVGIIWGADKLQKPVTNAILNRTAEAEIQQAAQLQLDAFEDDIHRTFGLQNLTAAQFAELMDTYYLEFAFKDFITRAEFYRQNFRRHSH